MCEHIADLNLILDEYLPENQKISSYKTTRISRRNKNRIFQLEAVLNDGNTIYFVAKTMPKEKDDVLNVTQTAFLKEINFYSTVLPILKQFEEKEKLDELYFIPDYYGSSLNNDSPVLLLEDLKIRGYKNVENNTCLDLVSTRQVLKDLASFHALPIALNVKDAKIFDIKIKRHVSKKTLTAYSQKLVEKILKILEDVEICDAHLSKIRERLEEGPSEKPARVPFSTLIHSNCCTKNILTKNDNDSTPDIKIVNYESCSYGSPAEDLIFFLYTSVQKEILEEHLDSLMAFYHSNLVRVLEECGCDPTSYSLEGLLKEMKIVAVESQMAHIIFRIFLNFDDEKIVIEKLTYVYKDFVKKGWI